jgi:hypothetical protein
MKEKYITLQIRQACLSNRAIEKKDIHEQLKKTIAERKKIMNQFEQTNN